MCFTVAPRASFICRPCRRRQNQRQKQRQQAKHYLVPLFICKCPCLGFAFIYFLLLAFFSQRAKDRWESIAAPAVCSLPPGCNPLLHLAGITLGFLSKDKPETTAWEGRAFGAMATTGCRKCHSNLSCPTVYGHVRLPSVQLAIVSKIMWHVKKLPQCGNRY